MKCLRAVRKFVNKCVKSCNFSDIFENICVFMFYLRDLWKPLSRLV